MSAVTSRAFRVAAYQAPLLPAASMAALDLIRRRVESCEREDVDVLCCPEAILGGLADYASDPSAFAIDVRGGQLDEVLAPLASDRVTTVVGFTERDGRDNLYNSAAVFHKGVVAGVYRKLHPAIRRSIYQPGDRMPVFEVDGLKFGIVICNDSNYREPATVMASLGATVLFVPTNSGLPADRASVAAEARAIDIAHAKNQRMWVVRADVVGRCGGFVAHGSSGIIDPDGTVIRSAQTLAEDLIVATIGS